MEVDGLFAVGPRHVATRVRDHVEQGPEGLQNFELDHTETPYVEAGEPTEALAHVGKDMPRSHDSRKLLKELWKGEVSKAPKALQKMNPILTPNIIPQKQPRRDASVQVDDHTSIEGIICLCLAMPQIRPWWNMRELRAYFSTKYMSTVAPGSIVPCRAQQIEKMPRMSFEGSALAERPPAATC